MATHEILRQIRFFRMTFLDKMFGYKVSDLLKNSNLYLETSFMKVVVVPLSPTIYQSMVYLFEFDSSFRRVSLSHKR